MNNLKKFSLTVFIICVVLLAFVIPSLYEKIDLFGKEVRVNSCPVADVYNINPQEIERLINVKRRERDLSQLTNNKLLVKSSVLKAREMVEQSYFAHKSPDGSEPWDFFDEAGYKNWYYVGENLARGYLTSERIVDGWMNSDGHREIMLNKDITEMGVGIDFAIEAGGKPSPYVVLHVGKPK